MRAAITGLVAATVLFAAGGALAAPTCEDHDGYTIKCGVAGAMPVGWSPPEGERLAVSEPVDPMALLMVVFWVGGLLALIAAMPEFDGWDRQEGDDERG